MEYRESLSCIWVWVCLSWVCVCLCMLGLLSSSACVSATWFNIFSLAMSLWCWLLTTICSRRYVTCNLPCAAGVRGLERHHRRCHYRILPRGTRPWGPRPDVHHRCLHLHLHHRLRLTCSRKLTMTSPSPIQLSSGVSETMRRIIKTTGKHLCQLVFLLLLCFSQVPIFLKPGLLPDTPSGCCSWLCRFKRNGQFLPAHHWLLLFLRQIWMARYYICILNTLITSLQNWIIDLSYFSVFVPFGTSLYLISIVSWLHLIAIVSLLHCNT